MTYDIFHRTILGTVLLKTADELLNFSNEEEARLEEVCFTVLLFVCCVHRCSIYKAENSV